MSSPDASEGVSAMMASEGGGGTSSTAGRPRAMARSSTLSSDKSMASSEAIGANTSRKILREGTDSSSMMITAELVKFPSDVASENSGSASPTVSQLLGGAPSGASPAVSNGPVTGSKALAAPKPRASRTNTRSNSSSMRGSARALTSGRKNTRGSTSTAISEMSDYDRDEEKLNMVPVHMLDRVPLHLQRQTAIAKRKAHGLEMITESPQWGDVVEVVENGVRYRTSTAGVSARARTNSRNNSKSSRASSGGDPSTKDDEESDDAPPEFVSEKVNWKPLAIGMSICALWSLVAIGFIVFHALHFILASGEAMHYTHAQIAVQGLDSNASATLSPALAAARAAAIVRRSGLTDGPNALESLATSLAPYLSMAPGVRYVQAVGATGQLALVVPGTLHEAPPPQALEGGTTSTAPQVERKAFAFGLDSSACRADEPFGCMGLGGLRCSTSTSSRAACWHGPVYVRLGLDGAELPQEEWVWSQRLLLHTDQEPYAPSGGVLSIDVAVDASGLQHAAQRAQPAGGAAFVCTEDGVILAGVPEWTRPPPGSADLATKLWDLSHEWARDPELVDAVKAQERVEIDRGSELVMVQPLESSMRGAGEFASTTTLRVLVVTPRSAAVSWLLDTLAMAALGVAGAPFGFALVLGLLLVSVFIVKCCSSYCRRDDNVVDFDAGDQDEDEDE